MRCAGPGCNKTTPLASRLFVRPGVARLRCDRGESFRFPRCGARPVGRSVSAGVEPAPETTFYLAAADAGFKSGHRSN
jgi:hypothetical protein